MIDIRITTTDAPKLPWERIAHAVLGTSYELSLIICADTFARTVNRTSRKKTYAPNVLSFPLTDTEGEIVLNIRKAQREANKYNHTYTEHVVYLFIHGLLHLKGMDHGDTMENAEKHFLKRFKDTYKHATHHHRN